MLRGRSPRGARGSTAVRRVRADCAHVRPAASCSAVAGAVTTAATAQGTSEARGTIEAVACTTGIDHQTPQTADEEPRTDGALRSSQSALRSSQRPSELVLNWYILVTPPPPFLPQLGGDRQNLQTHPPTAPHWLPTAPNGTSMAPSRQPHEFLSGLPREAAMRLP